MRIIFGLILGLSLWAATLPATEPFEGRIRFEVTDLKQRVHNLDYNLKGEKLRIDMATAQMGNLSVIVDGKNKISKVLMETRKTYTENVLKETNQVRAKKSSLEKTGKSETILGYDCQEFVTTGPRGKTELWATPGLGTFRHFESGPMNRAEAPSWEKGLMEKGLFPLKIVEPNLTMVATQIDKKSLPDSLFEVPEGYSKMDMNTMTGAAHH